MAKQTRIRRKGDGDLASEFAGFKFNDISQDAPTEEAHVSSLDDAIAMADAEIIKLKLKKKKKKKEDRGCGCFG